MKNKVLCLLHLPPPKYGVTIMSENIISGDLNNHFVLDVIAINTAKRLENIEKFSFKKIFTFLSIIYLLFKKLAFNSYSLCYFSLTPVGIGFYKNLPFVFLIKIFRLKVLYHLHGKGISLKKGFFSKMLYRFCFNNAHATIVSQSLSYDVEDYVPRERMHILIHGIKDTLTDDEFEHMLKDRQKRSVTNLLFLSNMIRSKGVFIALDAAGIQKKGHNFKFYFAGNWFDIKKEDFFSKVKELGLCGCVEYLGFIEDEEKRAILKDADVLVYPTCNDMFPTVNIEAMQFGLPVVSTYEGAIPDMIDDGINGFLVQKKDVEALAEKIEILIKDPALRIEMGRAGRGKFLRQYNFYKFQERLKDIFNEVINS